MTDLQENINYLPFFGFLIYNTTRRNHTRTETNKKRNTPMVSRSV